MAKIRKVTSIEEEPKKPKGIFQKFLGRQNVAKPLFRSKTKKLRAEYDNGDTQEIDLGRGNLNLEFENFRLDVLWADLEESNLRGCNFADSVIKESHLDDSDLSWCDFQGAKLPGSVISRCNFTGANFIGSSILTTSGLQSGTQFAGAIFIDVSMPESFNQEVNVNAIQQMKEGGAIMDRDQLRDLLNEMKSLTNNSKIDQTKAIQYLSILKNFEAIKGLKDNIRTETKIDENGEEKLLTIREPVIGEQDEKTLREKFGSLVNNGVVIKIIDEKEQGFVDNAKTIDLLNEATLDKTKNEMPIEVMNNIADFLGIPFENKIPNEVNEEKSRRGATNDDVYKPLTDLGWKLFVEAELLAPRATITEQNANQLKTNSKLQH